MTQGTKNPGPRWYQDAVIYQLHVKVWRDANGDGIGDFRGLISRLDYLQDLGVTAIWLLPFYPSPLRDDGYDTADYRDVHPSYGDMRGFQTFVAEAHERGLRVITELVLNHTSDQHEWFQRARRAAPGTSERDFYVWSDTVHRYEDTRIIFTDFESSNWSWDPVAGAYYWHRFYAHQPDLNWDNPDVVRELHDVVDYWFDLGVDGLRLDAVPYLFEREGTNCENLPETHDALRQLRAHVDARHDDKMLLAEANMWPDEVVDYFGDGDECHMAFHFPLMPRMYMALRMEDRFPIIDILEQTPQIPDGAQWAIFLRNHDELTLEMVTDEERDYMWRTYAEDERARINLGIRRRLAPLLGNNRRLIELMNSLLFSLPGTPVIYYGDEIGMGDNIWLGDRDGVRTPMQWSADRNAGFSDANPQRLYLPVVTDPEYHHASVNVEAQWANPESLLWWMKRTIALRRHHPALAHGALQWVQSANHKVLSYLRVTDEEQILCVVNLSRFPQHVELDLAAHAGRQPVSLHGQVRFPTIGVDSYGISLGAHDCYWFVLEHATAPPGSPDAAPAPLAELEVRGDAGWAQSLDTPRRTELEQLLPAWIVRQPWFRSAGRRVRDAWITDVIPVASGDEIAGVLAAVDLEFSDAEPERWVVVLAAAPRDESEVGVIARVTGDVEGGLVLFDGLDHPPLATALLDALVAGRPIIGDNGRIDTVLGSEFERLYSAGTSVVPAPLAAEEGSSIIAYGDRWALKLLRRLEPGINPDAELGRYLTEQARFEHAPSIGATLDHVLLDDDGDPIEGARSLAVLQGYVAHEGDAWGHTLDALRRFVDESIARPDGPPPVTGSLVDRARADAPALAHETIGHFLESARLLGERVAQLHAALAAAPDDGHLGSTPMTPMYRRSLYQAIRGTTKRSFAMIRGLELGQPELDEVLALEQPIVERLRGLLDIGLDDRRIRVHGDLHLGQVLWTGRDFCIVDFEGEPMRPIGERRIRRTALKDVAGIVRSLDYAAWTVLHEGRELYEAGAHAERLSAWIEYWYGWVSATFLGAYLTEAAGGGWLTEVDADLETLLDAMLIEKAIYELAWEATSRPERAWIPARGLQQLLGGSA